MQLGPGDAAAAVERHPCPQCNVPAGSACRTRAGKTAAKYHTARFILVPALRDELTAPVPTNRGPGKKWTQGPEVAPAAPETNGTPIRIGYARSRFACAKCIANPPDSITLTRTRKPLQSRPVGTPIDLWCLANDRSRTLHGRSILTNPQGSHPLAVW
jgi:hypothetical protein